jgi:hypothetical protein
VSEPVEDKGGAIKNLDNKGTAWLGRQVFNPNIKVYELIRLNDNSHKI